MADLHIQALDQETIARLKDRASQRGVSIEEEARRILQQALASPERLGQLALQLFGSEHGVDIEIPKRETAHPLDFSK
jgi:plasmid stability protein